MNLKNNIETFKNNMKDFRINKKMAALIGTQIVGITAVTTCVAISVNTPTLPNTGTPDRGITEVSRDNTTARDKSLVNIIVNVDGTTKIFNVVPGTVQNALKTSKINLKPTDEVSVPLSSLVTPNENITVHRVNLKTRIQTNVVNFGTKKQAEDVQCDDANAATKIVTQGVSGENKTVELVKNVDGVDQNPVVVNEIVSKDKVDEVWANCKQPDPTPTVSSDVAASLDNSAAKQNSSNTSSSNNSSSSSAKPTASSLPTGSHEDWMRAAGISESDFGYVNYIVSKESGWNYSIYNTGGSGAFGLLQSMPGEKMSSAGADWKTNPVTQLKWGNSYAVSRYGSWANAYNFWVTNHWW